MSVAVLDVTTDPGRSRAGVRRRWHVAPFGVANDTVVVLQHGEHATPGLLLDVLFAREYKVLTARPDIGRELPSPAGHRFGLIIGDDTWEPTVTELEWIAEAHSAGTALFAVGSGAHALALALGGDSAPTGRRQRGWITVASADPDLVAPGPWFAWQERVLRLPPGAELLASSPAGPQAFRIGAHIGVQFHPEITPELVREWLPRSPETLDHQGLQEATARDFPLARVAARKLFSAFLDANAA